MTDRTERQKRDEATEPREELFEAQEPAPEVGPDPLTLSGGAATPERVSKPRRAPRKGAAGKTARATQPAALDPEAAREAEAAERSSAVTELESQGFTEDEAIRLFDMTKRLEHSPEAQYARRLRFMRWLVEQGMMDEFSA